MEAASFINATYRDAPGSPIRELARFSSQPGMVSLAGGHPDPRLMDAAGLQRILRELPVRTFASALEYGATEGDMGLRTELARLSASRGLRTQAAEVLVLSGSQQGIDLLARTLLTRGDAVLVEAPTYSAAISAFRFAGAEIHQLASDDAGIQLDALEEALERSKPKLLYLVPTFGNPGGRTMPLERRRAVLALAARHHCLVVASSGSKPVRPRRSTACATKSKARRRAASISPAFPRLSRRACASAGCSGPARCAAHACWPSKRMTCMPPA